MTEGSQIAMFASIPPTLLAFGTLLVSLRNSAKTEKVIEKTAEIHTLTNGNLSKMEASLGVANEKIIGLEKLLAAIVKQNGGKSHAPAGESEAL